MNILGLSITRPMSSTRNSENPSDPIDFDDGIGGVSESGISVTERTAMGYAPVWRGVSLISRDVAKMPLYAYERISTGGKERATGEAVYRLLRYKPNPYMNAFNFKQFIQSRALLTGNGYAFIERNRSGKIMALWPLNDYNVCPFTQDGELFYEITGDNGRVERILLAEDVFHIRGIGNRIQGYSLIEYAQESIGLGLAAQKYTSKFFSNGARPQIMLQHPGQLSDPASARLLKSFNKSHQGIDKAFNTAILEEGMTLATVAINNRESQLEELVKLTQKEVSQFLNIPLGKMGESESVSYNSAEQENQSYLDNALDPWLVAWESECFDKLLTKPQQDSDRFYFEFLRESLVRMNAADRTNQYASAIQNGWMTVDEVRAKANMNPFPDDIGAKPFRPLNMVVAGEEVGDDNGDIAETNSTRSAEHINEAAKIAATDVLCDALRRVCGRWRSKADAAQRKGGDYEPELRFFDEIIEVPYELCKSLGDVEPYARMRDRLAHEFKSGKSLADLADLALFIEKSSKTEQI